MSSRRNSKDAMAKATRIFGDRADAIERRQNKASIAL
jgi:hypothetical protein